MKIAYAGFFETIDRQTRAMEILPFLKQEGHSLFVIGSGRFFGELESSYSLTFRVLLPPSHIPEEELDLFVWQKNRLLLDRLERFQPDLLLLDGEMFGAKIAHRLKIPIVSIDPLHFLDRSRLNLPIPPNQMQAIHQEREQRKGKSYRSEHYLLPLFFSPEPVGKNTKVVTPVIRTQVANAQTSLSNRLLVVGWPGIEEDTFIFREVERPATIRMTSITWKQTQEANTQESEIQNASGAVLRRRKAITPRKSEESEDTSVSPQQEEKELSQQLPPSDAGVEFFWEDSTRWATELARCQALLLDGGHLEISEAIALKKPMLLILNVASIQDWVYSHYVEKMGFGEVHPRLTKAALEGFLQRIERYQKNLEKHAGFDNQDFLHSLNECITSMNSASSRLGPPHRSKRREDGDSRKMRPTRTFEEGDEHFESKTSHKKPPKHRDFSSRSDKRDGREPREFDSPRPWQQKRTEGEQQHRGQSFGKDGERHQGERSGERHQGERSGERRQGERSGERRQGERSGERRQGERSGDRRQGERSGDRRQGERSGDRRQGEIRGQQRFGSQRQDERGERKPDRKERDGQPSDTSPSSHRKERTDDPSSEK